MIRVEQATKAHARAIDLRPGDAAELDALGLTMVEAFEMSMSRALWAETYLLEGDVAAIVGLSVHSLLGSEGVPWLLTGRPVDRCRRDFLRLTRAGVARMLDQRPTLSNLVHAEYRESVRWMRWLGFGIAPPQPFGAKRALFHRATLRKS